MTHGAFMVTPTVEGERVITPSLRYKSSRHAIEASVDSVEFDIRCMQVLRNILLREVECDEWLSSIVVSSPNNSAAIGQQEPLPIPEEETELAQYPRICEALGFECISEELGDTWVRRCMVEFVEPMQLEDLEMISTSADLWFDLLESGGYAFPMGHPRDIESVRGGVAQFDEYSIEISLMRFHASDMAWNALINMLRASNYLGTVKSLTFD
jgi:hypothetical protein